MSCRGLGCAGYLLMVRLDRRVPGAADWRPEQGNHPLRGSRPRPRRGHGPRPPEGPGPASASPRGSSAPGLRPRHPGLCLCRHVAPALFLMRTLVTGLRATQRSQNEPVSRPLITPAKPIFQNVPIHGFWGEQWEPVFWGTPFNPLLAGLVGLGGEHTQVRRPCCHTPPGVPDTHTSPRGGPRPPG